MESILASRRILNILDVMRIFDELILAKRREKVADALADHLKDGEVALFYCGDPIQKPGGLDQTYFFIPQPEYFWLTGFRKPRGIVSYSKNEGWTDFVQLPTVEERLWEGGEDEVAGRDISEFDAWLGSNRFSKVVPFGKTGTPVAPEIQEAVNRARRPKDSAEIDLIKRAASMAAAGYQRITNVVRPGISERAIQIEYEAEVLRAGAEKFPYDTIVGSGKNAAVLHAIPTAKKVSENELVLIDGGADLYDYCVDITRTFSSSAKFTTQQKAIYDLVLQAQLAAIEKCRPRVEWHDVHRTAARVLAQGLKDLGLLTCAPDVALESEAISVFLPHGVGHMVGLKVRDVGGVAGRPVRTCCGVRVRVDLPLEENFVMTVEPGLYFVQALLDRAETRTRFKDQIAWAEVEKWRDVGGVRIEDDIQVTGSEPVNLTAEVPK